MKKKIIILLIAVVVLGFSSCDPEKTPDSDVNTVVEPAYIGTWSMEEVDDTGQETVKYKYVLLIKNNIMETYFQIEKNEEWADCYAMKGTYVIDENQFDFTCTHKKEIASEDLGIKSFPEEWTAIAAGDIETRTITWSVEGNKITLTSPPITEGGEPTVQVLTKVAE